MKSLAILHILCTFLYFAWPFPWLIFAEDRNWECLRNTYIWLRTHLADSSSVGSVGIEIVCDTGWTIEESGCESQTHSTVLLWNWPHFTVLLWNSMSFSSKDYSQQHEADWMEASTWAQTTESVCGIRFWHFQTGDPKLTRRVLIWRHLLPKSRIREIYHHIPHASLWCPD
jgi:hypothetical protein